MPVEHTPQRNVETRLRNQQPSNDEDTRSMAETQETSQRSPDNASTSNDEATIETVRIIKLPQPFWRDMPARWFTVAENMFALYRITSDETRYRHVLVNLDQDMLAVAGDIIDTPPVTGKYAALKARIIGSFAESSEARLRRLLRGQPMGEERPTLFLQRLRNLSGGQCNDVVLRTLFLEQLPENVRGILAISQLDDLALLATQADRVVEAMRPRISAVIANIQEQPGISGTTPPPGNSQESEIHELRLAIEALTREFRDNRSRPRFRSNSQSHRRRTSKTNQNDEDRKVCFFHRKFGKEARKCTQPCGWTQQQQQGN